MGLFSKLAHSTDLVEGMADRLDVDLAVNIAQDPETAARRIRSAAINCSHCTNQAGCADLQADHPKLAQAPEYCRNGGMLAHMPKG